MSALGVLTDVLRSLFQSTTSLQARETPEQYATRQAKQLLRRLSAMPLASRLALARALVPGMEPVERKLLEAARACMRETGWHLAMGAQHLGSDGVLEAACSEVEAQFAELLTAAEEPPHGS